MKAEYVNSFYKAIQDVFRLMLDLEVEKSNLKAVEGMICSKDVNVLIGVTGDLRGSLLFSFTNDMSLKMVKIMSGLEMKEIDNFVSSAIGEVVNIVGGNALTNLSAQNNKCDISPPQIFIGQHKSFSMANKKALLMSFKTLIGEFEVNIFLAEN